MIKIFDYADLKGKQPWNYSEETTPENDGISPIVETEIDELWGELLIINGEAYHISCMSAKNRICRIAYARRLDNQSFIDDEEEPEEQYQMDEITCPYCKYEIESFEMQDEDEEYICENCKSTFSYQREITVTYDSQPVKRSVPLYL